MYSNPVFLERSFYFLSKYTRWKFFLLLMRHFTKLRKLSSCYFFETVEVVANGGEGTEIVGVVANDGEATEILMLFLMTVKQRKLSVLDYLCCC